MLHFLNPARYEQLISWLTTNIDDICFNIDPSNRKLQHNEDIFGILFIF